jgi:hypothetical protein
VLCLCISCWTGFVDSLRCCFAVGFWLADCEWLASRLRLMGVSWAECGLLVVDEPLGVRGSGGGGIDPVAGRFPDFF